LLLLSIFSVCRAAGPAVDEYRVKALFLVNFARFVEWPADAPQDPIVIGIIGQDPFGRWLDDAVRGTKVNGHELVVRRLRNAEDARKCRIVFVAGSESSGLQPILDALKGAPVLTIGDTEGFAELGGVINLRLEDNRVRFDINQDAARRAGLTVSSKLLSLARIVKDTGSRVGS